ncbi:MAG: hypothetical protein CW346_07425 [Bacillaceae bacterium]|nr:hypothetical protein [Bacillaceae bacterium]
MPPAKIKNSSQGGFRSQIWAGGKTPPIGRPEKNRRAAGHPIRSLSESCPSGFHVPPPEPSDIEILFNIAAKTPSALKRDLP